MQIKYRPGEFLGTLHMYKQSHVLSGMPRYLHLNQTTYIYSTHNIPISAFFLSGFLSATRSRGVSKSQIF
ncbi:hypothetical protein BDZ91DRAFT_726997 [Kalaharituber pfeilii]|nr:hypothetical protein BDZ91DRAFT_726997 [Kalaharituber pfeilii]